MSVTNGSLGSQEVRTSMHRLREAREQEGVSLQTMADRLRQSVPEVAAEEDPSTDINLSTLHKWSKALSIPVRDLLFDCDNGMSLPRLTAERMRRLDEIAQTIAIQTKDQATRSFAEGLSRQLQEFISPSSGP